MRVEITDNGTFRLFMSRRNLNTLLAKLDGHPPGSKCTIGSGPIHGIPDLFITAEEDDVHYSHPTRLGIKAGPMHSDTEAKLAAEPIGGTDDNSGDSPQKTQKGAAGGDS